jgi:hypothetical protein
VTVESVELTLTCLIPPRSIRIPPSVVEEVSVECHCGRM